MLDFLAGDIRTVLQFPCCESCLRIDVAELYMSDRSAYETKVCNTVGKIKHEPLHSQAAWRVAIARLLVASAALGGSVDGLELPPDVLEVMELIASHITALSKHVRWPPFFAGEMQRGKGEAGVEHAFENFPGPVRTVGVDCRALIDVGPVAFPPPNGVEVNMMPFIMGKDESIPQDLHGYLPLIRACDLPRSEIGKVGFLTIHEAEVNAGESHRRGGLHIDCPGVLLGEDGGMLTAQYVQELGWGRVASHATASSCRQGGIYMASSIPNSTRVWNALIEQPADVADSHGGVEHLRGLLGDGHVLPASRLVWMTDRTPHESLRLESTAYRQYFRLVTSNVSVWYEKHSTANPLGILPDPETTMTLTHDKFDVAIARAKVAEREASTRILKKCVSEGVPPGHEQYSSNEENDEEEDASF